MGDRAGSNPVIRRKRAESLENKGFQLFLDARERQAAGGDIGKILLFVCHWFWIRYYTKEGQGIKEHEKRVHRAMGADSA